MMKLCDKCKDYTFADTCGCEPYTVIDEDGDDHEVYAIGEHSAALKYAEDSNTSGDYYLMDETIRITVNGTAYNISAEPDVHYSANEV